MFEVSPDFVGVLVALVVLVGWAALSNILFGHQTFFRSSGEGGQEDQEPSFNAHDCLPTSPGPDIVPQAPAPTYTEPLSTPDRLQALLPQDLVSVEVLTFLSPYDVTLVLPVCQFLNTAGEQPAYWNEASRRSTVAWIRQLDMPSTVQEKGEEIKGDWDLSGCESPKLEFFRRMFLSPYQSCNGHCTRTSCRVIVKGKVGILIVGYIYSFPPSFTTFFSPSTPTREKVYDVTPFLSSHPGGDYTLLEHAGHVDATAFFDISNHSDVAKLMMREYLIWDPTPALGRAGTVRGLFYADPSPVSSEPSSWKASFVRMPLVRSAIEVMERQQRGLSRSSQTMMTGEESRPKRGWLMDDRRVLYMRKFVGDKRPPNIVKILGNKQF